MQTFVRESKELVYAYVNGKKITTTPEHPFYVLMHGWTIAIELHAGDILISQNGDYVIVEKIQHEILETPVKVYNFEVEDSHTYYVGTNSILVHNTCKFTPDQQAVLDLAREYKNGLSRQDAQTLWSWAHEYGISGHGPMSGHGNMWQGLHIKIKNIHIPIFLDCERTINMTLFSCNETNVITEEPYDEINAGFCIVEKYDYVYQKELPRFNEKPGIKPYGLPYWDKPKKMYLGIGNLSSENATQNHNFYSGSCLKSEKEVIEIRNAFFSKEHCDVVWFKVHDSDAIAPNGYESCGYDITYVPEINGAYSIINDCMFICKWHGCDNEGTAFLDYFIALNKNGLFDDVKTAFCYMKYYLSFEWSERGEFCICEIFRKKELS